MSWAPKQKQKEMDRPFRYALSALTVTGGVVARVLTSADAMLETKSPFRFCCGMFAHPASSRTSIAISRKSVASSDETRRVFMTASFKFR